MFNLMIIGDKKAPWGLKLAFNLTIPEQRNLLVVKVLNMIISNLLLHIHPSQENLNQHKMHPHIIHKGHSRLIHHLIIMIITLILALIILEIKLEKSLSFNPKISKVWLRLILLNIQHRKLKVRLFPIHVGKKLIL